MPWLVLLSPLGLDALKDSEGAPPAFKCVTLGQTTATAATEKGASAHQTAALDFLIHHNTFPLTMIRFSGGFRVHAVSKGHGPEEVLEAILEHHKRIDKV